MNLSYFLHINKPVQKLFIFFKPTRQKKGYIILRYKTKFIEISYII